MTDRLFGWGRRAEKEAPDATESAPSNERIVPTKAFSRFLYAWSLRESPIVLDGCSHSSGVPIVSPSRALRSSSPLVKTGDWPAAQ